TVIAAVAGYVTESLQRAPNLVTSVAIWESEVRARLAERLAAADFLSRAGRRDRAVENELLRQAAQLAPDDPLRLAALRAGHGASAMARRLLEPFWRLAKVEGRRAVLPDSLVSRFYFWSPVRLPAKLLIATLQVDPAHALAGPLLETVVQ